MDAQLKRGLLEVCVLAVIRNKPSYGYRIIKDMEPYVQISESTLYTILKRLEEGNLLTDKTVEHNSRLCKYYHITNEGLNRIEEFKGYWPDMVAMYQFITMRIIYNDQKEFLNELERKLKGLPKQDIEDRLSFYSEMIDDYIEDGLTIEEAINKIGSSDEIVSKIVNETSLTKLSKKS